MELSLNGKSHLYHSGSGAASQITLLLTTLNLFAQTGQQSVSQERLLQMMTSLYTKDQSSMAIWKYSRMERPNLSSETGLLVGLIQLD